MKASEFAYWLQGYFELAPAGALSVEQAECIKRHLSLVFIHDIDPSYPAEQHAALSEAHAPAVKKVTGKPAGKVPMPRPTPYHDPNMLIRC